MIQYLICTMPRTGANLLCDVLRRTKVAGNPREFIHWEDIRQCLELWNIDAQEYPAELRRRETVRGVFGFMAHGFTLCELQGTGIANDWMEFFSDAPKCIFLTRKDVLRQAISSVIAEQNGVYRRTTQGEDRSGLVYCRERIDFVLRTTAWRCLGWEDWFTKYGITPFHLTYEELDADLPLAVRRVLEFLGIEYSKPVPSSVLLRQSDAVNEAWYTRYLSEVS